MATSVDDFENNRNAVIFHYSHLCPYGPAYIGEKPTGCVVSFLGYSISASIYWRGFRVFKNSKNFSKWFLTLREAKNFVIGLANKERDFFV